MIAKCDMSFINNNTFNKTKSVKVMISSSLNQPKTFFLFYEMLAIIISIIIIFQGKSKIPYMHIQGIDRYTILIQFLPFFLKKKLFHRRKLFQNLSRHKQNSNSIIYNHA